MASRQPRTILAFAIAAASLLAGGFASSARALPCLTCNVDTPAPIAHLVGPAPQPTLQPAPPTAVEPATTAPTPTVVPAPATTTLPSGAPAQESLSVSILTGDGTVSVSPDATLACGDPGCPLLFASGTTVTLTATANSSPFTGWTGPCAGQGPECSFAITEPTKVAAEFGPAPVSIVIGNHEAGDVVTPAPSPKWCGAPCYAVGTTVTIDAVPHANFVAWEGACAGQGDPCVLTIAGPTSVVANFTSKYYSDASPLSGTWTVSLTKAGSGAGKVVGGGIDCGGTCMTSYPDGSTITLVATAEPGSRFSGWGGACHGSSSVCMLGVLEQRTVVANFGPAALPILPLPASRPPAGDPAKDTQSAGSEGQATSPAEETPSTPPQPTTTPQLATLVMQAPRVLGIALTQPAVTLTTLLSGSRPVLSINRALAAGAHTLRLPRVPAGRYTLRLVLVTAGGQRQVIVRRLRIR